MEQLARRPSTRVGPGLTVQDLLAGSHHQGCRHGVNIPTHGVCLPEYSGMIGNRDA